MINWGDKPVIVLGFGVRLSGADPKRLLELGVPIVASWLGADLVDNWHPSYFGTIGVYGQRAANKIFYEADTILAIGCRMSSWMIGHAGLRPEQKLTMVDCDWEEVERVGGSWISHDIPTVIASLPIAQCHDWMMQCGNWADQYPLIENAHKGTQGYLNSYQIMAYLNGILRPNEQIVVDTGSLMCPVFQAMRFNPPQRVHTSGCLGEMGNALPGAIGISMATGKGEVLCLMGDGGFLMNVQELATVKYHDLPIKMIVFENDGYSMIKGTFATVKRERAGVDRASGLGLADAVKVSQSFGINSVHVWPSSWPSLETTLQFLLNEDRPMLVQISIDPEQEFVPRLKPVNKDGVITPPRFDQLSPILD
jgi:acetolactate synthase I/II/III large subunit